jgi:hypothetical protein
MKEAAFMFLYSMLPAWTAVLDIVKVTSFWAIFNRHPTPNRRMICGVIL